MSDPALPQDDIVKSSRRRVGLQAGIECDRRCYAAMTENAADRLVLARVVLQKQPRREMPQKMGVDPDPDHPIDFRRDHGLN